MIRYNHHLATFKEVFNDVIEERSHINDEERNKLQSERINLLSQDKMSRVGTNALRGSASVQMLTERLGQKNNKKIIS